MPIFEQYYLQVNPECGLSRIRGYVIAVDRVSEEFVEDAD